MQRSRSRPAGEATERATAPGVDARRVCEHGFIRSIRFPVLNDDRIERTAKVAGHDAALDPSLNGARAKLDRWQAEKRGPVR
ncbi:MAG TPA: hypothetical protein VMU96_13680 [Casimicrobiaceae bacterium]|nr:hypothetical protein [Casimicrobiaceae bacterium]